MKHTGRAAVALAVLAAGLSLPASAPAAPAPPCAGSATPRTLYSGQGLLESVIVGRAGRLYFSSTPSGQPGRLMKVDHPGAPPRVLSPGIDSPGGMVFHQRRLIVGYGDSVANGTRGDTDPRAGLFSVNPLTGSRRLFARGLGMANGVARAPDGAIYASNDFGKFLDRVRNGVVRNHWAEVNSGNGLVVDRAGRYLYAAQTFQSSAIARVEIAHPSNVTTFFAAAPEDMFSGFDGMTRDRAGNLFVAANGGQKVWRVDRRGRGCIVASGVGRVSAVAFGRGDRRFRGGNLYAVNFDGDVIELPRAIDATLPG